MGNNIGIDLFTQKSEITASTPEITIEITGLVQLNSFIGLDDTPTYYENGKFFKVEDNKIVYTDINWGDIKGKIEDNPELVKEIGDFIQEKTEQYTSETVAKAIKAHDVDVNAHQSIQLTIQDNYTALDNKIELNKIDSNTKFDQVNKRIDDNTEYITRVDNYSQEVNKKLEDLTLEVDVDIKGDINQLREDLTSTNQVVQDNYTTLDTKIDNTKSELDTKIDTVETNITKDIQDKYTALDTRISANTKDITDLTQTVQDDYKEINGHITDLYNKKVDKVEGKELSTNDFTDELKSKLENIEATAQVNIIESISVDGVPQTIDGNKNVDLHQPVYTLVKKDTPADTNAKEYNLTIDGTTTGVTIEIPKDVYIEKCTLKYVTAVDTPYTGAKVNDAYLQFDRANSTPIYTPIPELQIHAGQDITVDGNNVISTVIPIPRKISELNNDNYTVTDENYVHTDNNFTDGYIGRIEDLEATTVKNVEYNKTTQKITVTFGDKTTKILTLEELLTGASYDGETGDFTFTKANGEPVVVNTPKENFLSDVQYDGTTKVITFTMSSGSTFEVNVSDLIDVYTVKSTNSVEMSIENGNEISSNVKLSKTEGNIISTKTDGLYAKHQDISHLATKTELTDNVTTLDTKIDTTKTELIKKLNTKVDTTTYTAGLATKVDKVEGKSLISDTEIERLKDVHNYDDTAVKKSVTNLTTTVNNNYTTLDKKIDNTKSELSSDITALETKVDTKQDKKLFDKSKFTVVGSPTITDDGVASGWSLSNYVKIPDVKLQNAETWEIEGVVTITTDNNVATWLSCVTGNGVSLPIFTSGSNLSFQLYLSSLSSSWDISALQGSVLFPINSTIKCNLKFTGTQYIYTLTSLTTGQTENITVNSTNKVYQSPTLLGVKRNQLAMATGDSIDLRQFSVKVNGNVVFTGSKNIYQALDEKQNKLTAGTGIKIEGNTISNTQTSANWGNITGTLSNQKDLQNALNAKASTTSVTNLETEVTDLSGRVTANEADITTLKSGKQDKLTFDTTPTANSTKPVTSGGIKTALDKKIDTTRETKYMPLLYTKQSISNPTNMVAQPYVKLATVTFKGTGNYDLSQLFWLEYQQASTFKAHALVKLTARWGRTSYTGQVFEILEDYAGGNATWEGILKSLTWAYKFTAQTSTAGNILTGEIWIKIPNISYCTYYLRPTECNCYNDYGQITVTVTNNPWVYIYSNNQNVASITEGYTQVKVVDKSTYTLKANKTDLPTIATTSKTGLVKPDGKTIKVETDGTAKSIGVINSADNTTALKTWTGTRTEYDNIKTKDKNTLYNVLDDNDLTRPILEAIYPVGSIYLTFNDSCPLSTFFGTWELVGQDRVLQGAGTRGAVGTELSESLPNIKGTYYGTIGYNTADGALATGGGASGSNSQVNRDTTSGYYWNLNASRSSSTYKDNAPVQQNAILVNIFRRIS